MTSELEGLYSSQDDVPQPASMSMQEMGSGFLSPSDVKWRDIFHWLHENGYKLRPRFHPDWVPSWKGTKKNPAACEDGLSIMKQSIVDAERLSDGSIVILKRVNETMHPHEAAIGTFLSSPEMLKDTRNHCAPILEVLRPPTWDEIILVMPLLREFHDPKFSTIGEVVGCIRQLFEGLEFLHEQGVAHRDCKNDNIMFDAGPMFPEGWHPARESKNAAFTGDAPSITRTESTKPIKYYFIDFGIALRFQDSEPHNARIIMSGDKSVPEFRSITGDETYDPFPTDVYLIGNSIKLVFLTGDEYFVPIRGLEFLDPLITEMTLEDPAKRPTMKQVMEKFDEITKSLTPWKLRAPAVYDRPWYINIFLWFNLTRRHLVSTIMRSPTIPLYP
jgi:serine/threonine protein kinase